MDYKFLSGLHDLPFCLGKGSLGENLDALAALEEPPLEHTTYQLWALLKAGLSKVEGTKILETMSELAWTSHLVERLHASCGLVHKRHPDYGADTLMARSFMHSFRRRFRKNTCTRNVMSNMLLFSDSYGFIYLK
eukprot:5119934-Amphidinium_carterae.1